MMLRTCQVKAIGTELEELYTEYRAFKARQDDLGELLATLVEELIDGFEYFGATSATEYVARKEVWLSYDLECFDPVESLQAN